LCNEDLCGVSIVLDEESKGPWIYYSWTVDDSELMGELRYNWMRVSQWKEWYWKSLCQRIQKLVIRWLGKQSSYIEKLDARNFGHQLDVEIMSSSEYLEWESYMIMQFGETKRLKRRLRTYGKPRSFIVG
jgi:hypothetical protein